MAQTETIVFPSRFDYSYHKEFSEKQKSVIVNECTEIIMDFSRVEYLDSSALGMMVMFHKKAVAANKRVSVRGAAGNTREILCMANMDKLFKFN